MQYLNVNMNKTLKTLRKNNEKHTIKHDKTADIPSSWKQMVSDMMTHRCVSGCGIQGHVWMHKFCHTAGTQTCSLLCGQSCRLSPGASWHHACTSPHLRLTAAAAAAAAGHPCCCPASRPPSQHLQGPSGRPDSRRCQAGRRPGRWPGLWSREEWRPSQAVHTSQTDYGTNSAPALTPLNDLNAAQAAHHNDSPHN